MQRWEDGQGYYDLARKVYPKVLAITGEVMDEVRRILATDATLSARDAVHAAIVITYQVEGICSFDSDFDRIAGCTRLCL